MDEDVVNIPQILVILQSCLVWFRLFVPVGPSILSTRGVGLSARSVPVCLSMVAA